MNKKALMIAAGVSVLAYVLSRRKAGLSYLADDEYIDIGPAPVVPIDANSYWARQSQNYNQLAYGYGSQYNPYNPYNYYPYNQQYGGAGYPATGYPYAQQAYSPYSSYGQAPYIPTTDPYAAIYQQPAYTPPVTTYPSASTYPGYSAAPYQYPTYPAASIYGVQPQQPVLPYGGVYPGTYPTTYPSAYPTAYGQAGTQCQLIPLSGNRCYPGYIRYQGMCRPRTCPVSYYR